MKYPLVSVIIPNYNHSLYLPERIESVLNQTYENFEVIILDDCSTDNSREIIERYQACEKVSNVVFNKHNSGSTFKQWQKGFDLSKGDYIWIAESDDSMSPEFLNDLVNKLINDKSIVLAFVNTQLITSDNLIINSNPDLDDYYSEMYTLHNGLNFIHDKMLYHNRIYNASAVLFKKSSLQNISSEYLNYKFCGDWIFWIEIIRTGNVLWLHKKYNRFRKHLNKVSPKADLEGLDFKEKHRLVHYLKYRLQLSHLQVISIVGNVFLNLIRSRAISAEAKKTEIKAWIKEYPTIPFYAILRFVQVFPRRIMSKTGIVNKYKSPRIIKSSTTISK